MINIAICDDEKVFLDKAAAHIKRMNINVEVDVFTDPYKLLDSMKIYRFDVCVLDIELQRTDGLSIANKIKALDENTIIIFLTNYDKYVYAGYHVGAFRYVRKSQMDNELNEAIDSSIKALNKSNSYIVLCFYNNETKKVPLHDVIMITKENKNVMFHLTDNTIVRERRTIADVEQKIKNDSFITIRKGVIINAEHIKFIDGGALILDNGETYYISREKTKIVKNRILKFWGKEIE